MILLCANRVSGVNPFFPLFVNEKSRTIAVIEWDQYRRLLPIFVIVNSFLTIALVVIQGGSSGSVFDIGTSLANVLVFLYVVLRLKFGRRMITIQGQSGLIAAVAPIAVWLDYFSLGTMFFLLFSADYDRTDSGFMRTVFIGLEIFFSIYAFLPVLNYLKYRART